MNLNALRALEFDKIRELLLGLAGSGPGRDGLAALAPETDPARVREALATTREGRRALELLGRQPHHDLPDLRELLPSLRVAGVHLEPLALADIASFLEGAHEIASRLARLDETPCLARRASEVADLRPLAAAIRRAVLPSGEIADDASPRLLELRRALVRLRAQLHSVMESFLRDKDADRLLQDKIITTRNDRYVLLLKADHRGQLPGIVHGGSGSGASLFVEPMPAVELNNDIVATSDEERHEVIRILRELTARAGASVAAIEHASRVLGELDAIQARALLAREMEACEPEIADELALELREARHPLLLPRLTERLGLPRRSSREAVPVTLRLGPPQSVLVVSGPNTGGKTVALKTAGLLALMAQCGLHLPVAEGSRLPVFSRVFADIGDEQSIAADLSTFSAHLKTIVEMTADLEPPALVLLDEVGAGTDPTEGGALGVAIVEHFRSRGAMVLTSTHHGLMKAYAQATPGVLCASFGYDPQTYEPSYRLELGVPGRSLALEMAERLGLPGVVVRDARRRREQKEAQAEALLATLEQERAALAREAQAQAAAREELAAERSALAGQVRQIEARKQAELQAFARELRVRGEAQARAAAAAIQDAVRKLEATRRQAAAAGERARAQALSAIREAREEALAVPGVAPAVATPEPAAVPVAVGGRVRVRELGVVGELLALHGEQAEVAVSGKRLRVPRADLLGLAAPSAGRAAGVAVALAPRSGGGTAEINLVGLTVDEALPQVDKLLDDAALAERRQVRVIHGFGAGRLRRAVAELLDGHPHVAAYRLGAAQEGGGGVTIVDLKE